MKKRHQITTILAIIFASLIWAGCASFSRNAYNAQSATQITAEAAMTAWGNYVEKYQPGPEIEIKVKTAYERYQDAMLATISASQAFARWEAIYGTNPPPEVQSNLDEALSATSQALMELISLIDKQGALKKGQQKP